MRGGRLNEALERLADYPFARLASLLAGVTPPEGVAPLAMSVGEPQHQPPAFLAEVLAANTDSWNRYPGIAGTPAFRESCAAWLQRRFSLPAGLVDPTHILPLSGTREALFLAAQLAVDHRPGANQVPAVALPDPFYAPYEGAATMAGAEPVFLPAGPATGFLPDLKALEADAPLLARLKLLYLCNPTNPQGAVASRAYLDRAIGLARAHGFILAVDECYAEIYDQTPPVGVLEVAAARDGGSLDNLLVFHSLSKRSNAAGLRSGFVAGDPALVAAFLRLRNHSAAGMPLPIQAASAALWADDAHVVANRALYRAKFDAAEAALGGRFGFRRPEGGFFLWLDVGDGEAAARRLWAEAAIRTLPGGYIAHSVQPEIGRRYLRIAVVHDSETVGRALTRLGEILSQGQPGAAA
jgi:N-succinyldiaminopimelate aminotransferase